MQDDLREKAEGRLETALREGELADPRDGYRALLRALRGASPDHFARALQHYEEVVLPVLAAAEDAVEVWIEWGRFLAGLIAPGRAVTVDGAGRSAPFLVPLPRDCMVLHLPDDGGSAAMPLLSPRRITPAQRATYDLLVLGKLSL